MKGSKWGTAHRENEQRKVRGSPDSFFSTLRVSTSLSRSLTGQEAELVLRGQLPQPILPGCEVDVSGGLGGAQGKILQYWREEEEEFCTGQALTYTDAFSWGGNGGNGYWKKTWHSYILTYIGVHVRSFCFSSCSWYEQSTVCGDEQHLQRVRGGLTYPWRTGWKLPASWSCPLRPGNDQGRSHLASQSAEGHGGQNSWWCTQQCPKGSSKPRELKLTTKKYWLNQLLWNGCRESLTHYKTLQLVLDILK